MSDKPIGTVFVPGVGDVPIVVTRSLTVHKNDGSSSCHLFLAPDLSGFRPPDGPSGGEPLPLPEAV
jgi:hypothetical protein